MPVGNVPVVLNRTISPFTFECPVSVITHGDAMVIVIVALEPLSVILNLDVAALILSSATESHLPVGCNEIDILSALVVRDETERSNIFQRFVAPKSSHHVDDNRGVLPTLLDFNDSYILCIDAVPVCVPD